MMDSSAGIVPAEPVKYVGLSGVLRSVESKGPIVLQQAILLALKRFSSPRALLTSCVTAMQALDLLVHGQASMETANFMK